MHRKTIVKRNKNGTTYLQKSIPFIESRPVETPKPKQPVSVKKVEKEPEVRVPVLPVVIVTHNRTNIASAVIDSYAKNLKFNGKIQYIIADDRSVPFHICFLLERFQSHGINDVIVTHTTEQEWGLGASLNNGLKEAFKFSNVVLTTEDDWILETELNLTDYYDILESEDDLFGIRLGAIGQAETKPFDRHRDLDIVYGSRKSNSSIFNMQVMLRHKRAYDNLGYYLPNRHPDSVEAIMKQRYNRLTDFGNMETFKVLWPNYMKLHTLDDPSLLFTHAGKSTVGHNQYDIPERYKYIYNKGNTQEKRKILVVSAGTKNLEFQYSVTNQNKEEYCKKHGYDYVFVELKTTDKMSYHERKNILLDLIDMNKYEWIMWMDCDTWFNNPNIRIDDIIDNYANETTCLIVSRDQYTLEKPDTWHDCYINSGVLLLKCCDESKRIINIWKNPPTDAVRWMKNKTHLNDQPYLSILMLWDSFVKDHTVIVYPRALNTFARIGFDENCFILHVPGNKEKRCRKWYTGHFNQYYYKSIADYFLKTT